MGQPLPFELGAAAGPFFWFGAGVVFTLILVAVLIYLRRVHHTERIRVQCELQLLEGLADEKKLEPEEKKTLFALIKKRFPDKPLCAVQDRALFDDAVQRQIAELEAKGDEHGLRMAGRMLRVIREKLGFGYVPLGQRIWTTRELYEGQTVWLATQEDPAHWCETVVSAVDEAFLHLTLAGERASRPSPFKAGDTVRCRLWRGEDARYLFNLQIRSCDGQPVTYLLRHTSDLNRMQAREHYRVHFTQPTDLGLLHKEHEAEADEEPAEAVVHHDMRIVAQWPAHFMNLSAGGFAIVAQKPLPVNATVKVSINLPGEQPFEAQARTVGEEKISGDRHLIRGEFVDLSEDKRDVIARFILIHQQQTIAGEHRE